MINSKLLQWAEKHLQGHNTGRTFLAHCPLHSDSSPSFSIYLDSGNWICFAGCGKGNFYELVKCMNVEQISLGNVLSADKVDVTEEAWDWRQLYEISIDNRMPKWFFDRGFTFPIIKPFNIRYSQDFNCIVIPSYDLLGRLIGIIMRGYGWTPKYRYSPGYPKSVYLFNENRFKLSEHIYLVEGQLDAIWGSTAGLHCLALGGLDISDEQVKVLSVMKNLRRITVALDNDKPGQEAIKKCVDKLWPLGVRLDVFQWPEGLKDFQEMSLEKLFSISS